MDKNNQIVIELGQLYGEGSVALMIAEVAAQKILRDESEAASTFRSRVKAITDEEIRAAIVPAIAQALEEAVQPTDSFGQPKGDKTTLREVIVQTVDAQLRQTASDARSSLYDKSPTLLQFIIGNEVAKVVGEDLREAMNEARAQVKAAVEAKGAEVLAETISRLAKT